ncbi:MAG: DsbE family thiol:disulfide interchange protein [Methylobacterium mesophilicum]|nr:DsbE family thiol:disulfide interchange protein [Methylobacterium mesophilicum]
MTEASEAPRSRFRPLLLLPFLLFAGLAALFLAQLLSGRDAATIPSALIGAPAPNDPLPPLEGAGLPGFEPARFKGRVTLVNVWASWCVPCRDEHPLLLALSRDKRFAIAGINYKDKAPNALGFLRELGNPFAEIGVDAAGRAAIDWGVYGVPESFVVGKDGKILFKHVGPMTPESVRDQVMPAIEKALAG